MNYLDKIHSLDSFGSRPGLDRVKRFLDILGNPQDKLKFVHVAGTNGKGSVCQLLSFVLIEAGYKTGLFISPYILDFRERIQINGEMVSEEVLSEAVERTFPIIEKLRAEGCIITEFEYVNALQFLIHCESGCDIVVLETGMGGLLDSTNVIKPPLCSVITTIGLDHTAVLGDTIEEIAEQKCGIIKSGSAAVTSAQTAEVMSFIENDCRLKEVSLKKSGDIDFEVKRESFAGSLLEYKGRELFLPLAGEHQIENAKTALAAIEVLKKHLNITDESIVNGFKKARNPARLELLKDNVILDGAHNPNGIEALKNAIEKLGGGKRAVLILGMLADKDSRGSVKLLEGVFDTVFTVPVDNPRSLSSEELAEICRGFFDDVRVCESVFKAFDDAYNLAKAEDKLLVIAGSLYMAAQIRPYIMNKS